MGCDDTQKILLASEGKFGSSKKIPMSVEKIHTPSQVVKWGIEEVDGSVEVTSIDLSTHSDSEPSDLEDEQASVSSDLEDKSLSEEMDCSTPPANHESRKLLQSSSVVEISRSKDYSLSEPPRLLRGLDHSITAPVQRNLFVDSQGFPTSRSMIENRGYPRPDLKLDRLSEQKKKSIVDWMKIQNDGTVEVDLTKDSPVASELLELRQVEEIPSSIDCIITDCNKSIPKLNIAMLVVGTRGDVQPFLAMARRLQEYGHHVRLATHSNFRKFVDSHGIDFYPLGGDPRVLAASMARNKGLIPSSPKEIRTQRKQIKAIIETLLPACTEADPITGDPFKAQAIIANPPAYGHTHVAEALGVPLHIFFTMPWTPTYAFPHPFARVPQSAGYWLSYILVDLLIWWGIRAYINDFRNKLKLPPMAYFSTYHGSIYDLPTGYMWSPCLVPKPHDWGPLVDVVGYCFLDLESKGHPPEEVVQWIQKGDQPIYIGFGSMPLDDSNKIMDIILEALENTGQRGIIDRGWADLGTQRNIPDNVFLLKDCPHDWLFPQCSAVVHHGGAGTTATGLKAGCPTTVVPFFGDQFFWGERIYQRGLGPAPIPISQLTVDSLSEAIRFMLQPEIKSRATELGERIKKEDGVGAAVDAFHRHLPAELPLPPPPSSLENDDSQNPLQWVFIKIGTFCSLPCGRS